MKTVSSKKSVLLAALLSAALMIAPQVALSGDKQPQGDPLASWRAKQKWLEEHPKEKFTLEIEKLKPKAEGGDVWSMLQIADIYYGEASMLDYAEAAKWYHKAAERGAAPENLGVLYFKGWGVTQSNIEACFWYVLASFQNTDAIMFTGPPEELSSLVNAGERRAIRQRVAARIDQTDAHNLNILGSDALSVGDYEDAYFWYAAIQKEGITGNNGQYDSGLRKARMHLNDNAVRAVDLRVQEWERSAPRLPK